MNLFFSSLRRTISYSIAFFVVILLMRLFQSVLEPKQLLGENIALSYHFKGVLFDLFFVGVFSFFVTLLVLPFKNRNLFIIHLSFLLLLISNLFLTIYFIETNELLRESIYYLSFQEIKLSIGSEEHFNGSLIIELLLVPIIYFVLGRFIEKIKFSKIALVSFFIIQVISIFMIPNLEYKSERNSVETLIVNNKISVFLNSTFKYLTSEDTINKLYTKESFTGIKSSVFAEKSDFENYPLLHDLPSESKFASFFNKSKKGPPNIVFIIVESLSSCMVGDKAENTGHLMPFLDSLIPKSIFYPNFLSTCERTHNVLPASLASVPNAPNGNMLLTMEYPLHWSLISLLNKDYYSRFYCGVDLSFCNMNGYMNYHNTDYLVQKWEKQFSSKINGKNHQWGFPDEQLFRKSWVDLNKSEKKIKPRFDVFLTISTHDPFIIPKQKYYTKIVEDKINAIKNPTQNQKDVLNYASAFSTYIYTDDALKSYFKEARKNKDFDNTIFFIFGDHGNQFCLYDVLERYKTPLIIYSPLLKSPKKFNAVSTQLDLAPTVLNYLRTTYDLKLPEKVPFIGKELSFIEKYECKRTMTLNSINLDNNCLVDYNHFLYNDQLYKIDKDLNLKPHDNKSLKLKLSKQLELYNNMTNYVHFNDMFLPLNFYQQFTQAELFNLLYENVEQKSRNIKSPDEFLNIGKDLILPKHTKMIKIDYKADYYLESSNTKKLLPNLTFSLDNILSTGNNELVFWKQLTPIMTSKYTKKGWYSFSCKGVIRLKDYIQMKNMNQFKYYLLNSLKTSFKMKNIQMSISINPPDVKN
jgi:phosphoglycerol transferase MdoB-like AlkP superfamily enzyme